MIKSPASTTDVEPMTYAQMIRTMSATAGITETSAEDVQRSILERVLSANDADTVFETSGGLTHSDLLIGVPVEISSVKYMRTNYTESKALPFYAIATAARLDTGEAVTFSIGAITAVAQLFRFDTLDALPIRAVLRQTDRPTNAGYYPLFFAPVPA